MLKQTLTPYTGQLLALRTSGRSVQCIGPQLQWDTNYSALFVDDADSAERDHCR